MSDFNYTVTADDVAAGLTIKQLVRTNFTFSSRMMTKLKQQHLVKLNGEDIPWWISPAEGEVISVLLPEEKSDFPPEDIPISVVYEDDDILVINKQPGVVVHPTKGKPCHTIANGLQKKMLDEGASYKIRFVNRLDMNTSGLLIIAKNSHAQHSLVKQMNDEALGLHKKYKAIVVGELPEDEGTIDLPIGRPDPDEVERWVLPVEDGGYPSITHYKVLDRVNGHSLVELELETGRTHQIRVHLSYIGYPILGDHLYCNGDPFEYRRIHGDPRPPRAAKSSDSNSASDVASEGNERGDYSDTTESRLTYETFPEIVSDLIDRQALHAYSLTLKHPVTGVELHLEAPLPTDMQSALDKLRNS